MALSAGSSIHFAGLIRQPGSSAQQVARRSASKRNASVIALCDAVPPIPEPDARRGNSELKIGSPVIVVDAPPTLKTTNSISALRINAGLVKPGDVGRIIARKPKDVWAVRLAIGTYLMEGKHFKPLDLEEEAV